MINLKKLIAVLSLFIFAATLAGCKDEAEVYGKITKISNTKITIGTGTYEKPSPLPEDGSGQTSGDPSAADAEKPSARQSKNENGRAGKSEQNGASPGGMDGFSSDGGNASYILSGNIDITDLKKGILVKLTLDQDTVTAIETVGQPSDRPDNGVGSETGTSDTDAVYTVDGRQQASSDKDYEAEDPNVSAVLVDNKGALSLSGGTLTKAGDTTNDEESSFYGLNAIALAAGGSTVTLDGTTLSSSSSGSNAIFATGKGSKITAKNFKIYTAGDSARGLDATYRGTIVASDGDITTKGVHCAPIAADRGSGTVRVSNTSVSSEGAGSPCIYSTGMITASHVTGSAAESQIAVVEGKNRITMEDCILQGGGKNGILLYQSTSGDSKKGKATIKIIDSKLTTTSKGPMFYATNTDAWATLEKTTLYYSSGILANVAGNDTNNWGIKGANGGNFTLTGVNQTFQGDITCDKISTVSLELTDSSTFRGAINTAATAKAASVSLDRSSTWQVTGNSYVSAFTNKKKRCGNIDSNGYTIYYDSSNKNNSWLKGKTIPLEGGGKLMPAS